LISEQKQYNVSAYWGLSAHTATEWKKVMRIAFVSPEFITEHNYDGGLANYLSRVTAALANLGHQVTVVVRSTVDEEFSWNGVRVRRVAIGGPPLYFLNALLRDIRVPLDWLWQSWKINRVLNDMHCREHFDVVQYASYTAPGLFRLRGTATVVRLSSYEPLLQEAAGLEPSLARRLQAVLEQIALKRADGVYSPSYLVAQAAMQNVRRSVAVIESPFMASDTELDEQPYRDLLAGRRYLLFFGSIGLLKGIGTIATIIRTLLDAHQELSFVFVGKDLGHQGRPMMEQVWEQSGSFRGRVLYLGKMRQAQLQPIIRHAAGVVLPSRIDNLPNTCLEAMAQGKVVVGTYGTSMEQLIEDGVSGLLCSPDDPKGLLAAIETLLGNDEAWGREIGRSAQARIAQLTGPTVLDRLITFYRQCQQGSVP
jgi:glycosyltransferase involved in cell wall biosynthesis